MGISANKLKVDIDDAFKLFLDEHSEEGRMISVGCGVMKTECLLAYLFDLDDEKIIGIDPDPLSYNKEADLEYGRLPDYKTVADYIDECGNNPNNSLILEWPSPDDATYGIDAIEDLNPNMILIRYASCGVSGSHELQIFLNSCGCPSTTKTIRERGYVGRKYKCHGKYTMIYHDQHVEGSGSGRDGYTLDVVVLQRNSSV